MRPFAVPAELVRCAAPTLFLMVVLTMTACAAEIPLRKDAEEKTADPVMGSAAGWTVRLDIDGYFPDEGVLVSTTSPDFWKQGSGAFITKPPYLNGKEQQDYHRVYIRPTGEDWTEQMVTVVPDADGKLTLTCYAVAPGAMNIVQWDDVRVEGAKLENGGFEEVAEDGTPVGWRLNGWSDAPKGRFVHDPDGAAEGERYVESTWTWHWNAIVTDVVKDRPIVLRWKCRFIPPETRYPVRVGINGLHGSDPEAHTSFKMAAGMATDNKAPERYIGRLLDGFGIKKYGDSKAVNGALGIYLGEVGDEWQERKIRIEPESSGDVELTFHAARIRDVQKRVYVPVLVDYRDIKVEGATLPPLDTWQRIGRDTEFEIHRDGYVRTWYEAGLRTNLTGVKAGTPVAVTMQVRVAKEQ